MRMNRVAGLLLVLGLAFLVQPASAQEPEQAAAGALNLFFDCQGFGCFDFDYFRREIPYVNWVRDREDSDLHVLVTSQRTGGGGQEHRLNFIGRDGFAGQDGLLVVSTSGDATSDEVRDAVAQRLALGLVAYLADTPLADRLRVIAEEVEEEDAQAASPQDDPWDFWVFNLGLNGNFNGQSSQGSSNVRGSGSAGRVTEAWKFDLRGSYYWNRRRFELSAGDTIFYREEWDAESLLVKSLTPHWSAGVRGEVGGSTFQNERFRWSFAPGIEYNVFPYSESSRRSLTFQALLDSRYWDYDEVTIFGESDELRHAAVLAGSLSLTQPWGTASISLTDSYYLHDLGKNRLSLFGFMNVRLFRGFSVNTFASYSRIRDQLNIAAVDPTNEEILLSQRQLATSYSFSVSFGIQYRFGSIFNNVVNPRFGGSGGPIFFF